MRKCLIVFTNLVEKLYLHPFQESPYLVKVELIITNILNSKRSCGQKCAVNKDIELIPVVSGQGKYRMPSYENSNVLIIIYRRNK